MEIGNGRGGRAAPAVRVAWSPEDPGSNSMAVVGYSQRAWRAGVQAPPPGQKAR